MNPLPATANARLGSRVEFLEQRRHSADAATVHFARAVSGMNASTLDCSACQAALPEFIEAELNNRPEPAPRWIRRHLDLCSTCTPIYLDLLETALLAEEGLPPQGPLALDLSFLEQPPGRSASNV